ncbi:aminotransferase class V-fold PLP-dependent enzyme [Thermospira aquatica]|uniref:Aminotransferase class V-fold PLP-dependent enzyme n=1 Tax=Thermospira aquatica TaxID=2828656 RepID=A0AAX3BAW6_9SPIR|nr:aminotransferase class V-fold PLP-dependent enzyme [Thermospira aquatica]URA09256.1 aminotransferase class V-fold PLP-dependent enzyme [Thermospira aquatica]
MNTYFDNAATTFPKPPEVIEKVQECLTRYAANPGRGGHRLAREAESLVETARTEIGRLFGCSRQENVIFTLNATDAINMAIRGWVKPGDRVLATVYEHNAVLRVLFELEKKGIIDVKIVCPQGKNYTPEDFLADLDERTTLVCLNHVSNVTGMILPVEAISQAIKQNSRALVLVDVSQSAGLLHTKLGTIDMIAGTGHKHLYGPMGVGFLVLGEGIELEPWRVGGTGYLSEEPLQPREMPFRLEAGTPNLPGIAGLLAGIRWVSHQDSFSHDQRLVEIFAREIEKTDFTWYRPEQGVGVISLTHPLASPQDLATILDSEYDIASRAGLQCAPLAHKKLGTFPGGTLRVSFSLFHTEEDVLHLTETLRAIDTILRKEG